MFQVYTHYSQAVGYGYAPAYTGYYPVNSYVPVNQTTWEDSTKTNAIEPNSRRMYSDKTWFLYGRQQIFLDQLIGKGVFGEVYRVRTGANENQCLKIQEYNATTVEQVNLELSAMTMIKSIPGASRFLMTHTSSVFQSGHHCFLMEEMGCSLLNQLNRKTGPFDLSLIQNIGYQMIIGLNYLHSLGFIHCDIKPSNILITFNSNGHTLTKIADFGNVTRIMEMYKLRYNNCIQATWYRPPEVYLGLPQDHRTDIWAMGCILAEMYTGEALFVTKEPLHHLARLHYHLFGLPHNAEAEGRFFFTYFTVDELSGIRRPYTDHELRRNSVSFPRFRQLPREYSHLEQLISYGKNMMRGMLTGQDSQFIELLKCILQVNAERRPDASQLLQTPFFLSKWC